MKYVFPWQINTIAPFLLVFSAVSIASKQNARVRTIAIGLLVWASFNMILVGHRSGFAFVPLVLILTFVILKKDRFRWRYVLLGLAIMVSLPALVTLMREGRDISFATSLQYLNTIAIGRIFKTPLIVGMFYTDYADHHGFIGASVIRPLAEFFGDDYVLLAREIGQTYVAPTSETILSNANFLFVYYVGFGLWAIPISIIFMMIFDLLLIPASKYAMASLPIVVLLFIKGGGLSEGVFTTSFISGGYVFIPVIAFVVNFFYKNSIRKRDRQVYIEDSS